jgi:hypothetical protein
MFSRYSEYDARAVAWLERCCHRSQRAFGWNNYHWERALLYLSTLILFVLFAYWLYGNPGFLVLCSLQIGCNLLLVTHSFRTEKRVIDKLIRSRAVLASPDSLPLVRFYFCIMDLVLSVLVICFVIGTRRYELFLFLATDLIPTICIFLWSCVPLPPAASRLQKWKEARALRMAHVDDPVV